MYTLLAALDPKPSYTRLAGTGLDTFPRVEKWRTNEVLLKQPTTRPARKNHVAGRPLCEGAPHERARRAGGAQIFPSRDARGLQFSSPHARTCSSTLAALFPAQASNHGAAPPVSTSRSLFSESRGCGRSRRTGRAGGASCIGRRQNRRGARGRSCSRSVAGAARVGFGSGAAAVRGARKACQRIAAAHPLTRHGQSPSARRRRSSRRRACFGAERTGGTRAPRAKRGVAVELKVSGPRPWGAPAPQRGATARAWDARTGQQGSSSTWVGGRSRRRVGRPGQFEVGSVRRWCAALFWGRESRVVGLCSFLCTRSTTFCPLPSAGPPRV